MPHIVALSAYGGIDQLRIVDVPKPEPAAGGVVVRVIAAGTNPGEIAIREGHLKEIFPKDFPFGQGADFAGRVDVVGAGVTEFARATRCSVGRSNARRKRSTSRFPSRK